MMNTIMEEKIKQAFQEWKQADQPKETIVNTPSKNKTLANILLEKIQSNPGVTGKELRAYISTQLPTVPVSYVPALLKGFYDNNFVSRTEVAPDGEKGRTTYSYTIIPAHERATMPKREKVKAYTKKKTKTKAVPEDKGITTLISTERKTTPPLEVGPTTLHITISTSLGAYSMKLEEAKFIYQQLNQIFGGAR